MLRKLKSFREKRLAAWLKQQPRVERILVVRNGLLGDVVFITPVLVRLAHLFPSVRIDVVVSQPAVEMLAHFPSLDRIVGLQPKASIPSQVWTFLKLRKRRYDIAFIQETNPHYTIMAALTGARHLVSFEHGLDFLLSRSVLWHGKAHAVAAELETVRSISPQREAAQAPMRLWVSSEELDDARLLLSERGIRPGRPVVCFHPGCSEPNSARGWVRSKYIETADRLVRVCGAQIVFTGVGKDAELIESIRQGVSVATTSLAGQTSIRTFMSVLSLSHLVIGSDTGALHIATALGSPVLMLMGFTGPDDTGPYDPTGRSRYLRAGLPCSPCIHQDPRPPQWEICKTTRPVLCMERIGTEEVVRTARSILQTSAAPKP